MFVVPLLGTVDAKAEVVGAVTVNFHNKVKFCVYRYYYTGF
jgi:hypothetical protein